MWPFLPIQQKRGKKSFRINQCTKSLEPPLSRKSLLCFSTSQKRKPHPSSDDLLKFCPFVFCFFFGRKESQLVTKRVQGTPRIVHVFGIAYVLLVSPVGKFLVSKAKTCIDSWTSLHLTRKPLTFRATPFNPPSPKYRC